MPGMAQMHAGTRPGRPIILIALCGLALAGTLGLAWLQTRAASSLGPRVALFGPLSVRPPLGWLQDRSNTRRFVEAVRMGNDRQFERTIEFRYRRVAEVPSLEDAIADMLPDFRKVTNFEATTIGPLRGVQVIGERRFRWGNRAQVGQRVYRLALSPHGHQILIEFVPVREITPGDLRLLDAICAEVRIDDAAFEVDADPTRIGMELPRLDGAELLGPDLPDVPAVYLQGNVEGVPAWTIAVQRTWRGERSPRELLRLRTGGETPIRRVSGGERTVLAGPVTPRGQVYLVSEAPDRSAFVQVTFGTPYGDEAAAAVERVLADLKFTAPFPPAYEKAVENGASLVQRLAEPDRLRAWAGRKVVEYFRERRTGDLTPGIMILQRGPEPPSLAGVVEREFGQRFERIRWLLETDGTAYSQLLEYGRRGAGPDYELRQVRAPGSSIVESARILGRRSERFRFTAAAHFLCRPLEDLAAQWVAGQEGGAWIVSLNTPGEEGTHERLLQPLPGRPDGSTRVLLLDDANPIGRVLTFGPDGALFSDQSRLWHRERIPAELARQLTGGRR